MRIVLPALLLGVSASSLRAQSNPPATPAVAPGAAPSTNGAPPASTTQAGPSTTNAAAPAAIQTPPPLSKPAAEMTAEMERLKEEGKLESKRAVGTAVRKVVRDNSIQHDIPAPFGAKVIAVHKHPGDLVHIGDKIVTLLVNGKEVPILAKQEGVMQTINVSKGGIIGNSRPRAAKNGKDSGLITLTLRPLNA